MLNEFFNQLFNVSNFNLYNNSVMLEVTKPYKISVLRVFVKNKEYEICLRN